MGFTEIEWEGLDSIPRDTVQRWALVDSNHPPGAAKSEAFFEQLRETDLSVTYAGYAVA
jgi:hypothetical protein